MRRHTLALETVPCTVLVHNKLLPSRSFSVNVLNTRRCRESGLDGRFGTAASRLSGSKSGCRFRCMVLCLKFYVVIIP